MKGKRLLVILLALVLALTSFTACGWFGKGKDKDKDKDKKPNKNTETQADKDDDKDKVETVKLSDKALGGDLLIDFTKGANASVVFESDGWTNGDVFNVVWAKNNVKYANGKMLLGITKENKNVWLNDKEVTLPYTAGEARTQNYFGFGDYSVKMKPSANPGTASTFFVCTGNYDSKYVLDANGNVVYNADGSIKSQPNPHDEIDIEFLGKDTTKVQFNFFVDGKGGNEYMYDLGFDAAKEYHEYGFRWTKDSITWFIDGKPVYKVTTDKNAKEAANVRIVEKLPSTPGRLLMNHWCGNEDAEGWMGKYEGNVKDNGCEYQWIKTTTKGAPLNPAVTLPGGATAAVPEVDWSKISAINPTFESTEKYTVTTSGTSANVKYSSVGGSSYINVEMDITAAAKQKNVLHLTLKNNASKDVQVRVNVVDAELLAKGAKNSSTNKAATANGAEAKTDLEWGGSFFDIKAGETVEAVISFTGNVEKLQLMIDSSRNDAENRAGDVTVSNIKFAKHGEIIDENTVGKYKINPFDKIMKASADVNVRDLPAVEGTKIGSLKKGEVVAVTGQCTATGWYRISYNGGVGYVSGSYLIDAPGEYPAPSANNAIYINGKEIFFEEHEYTLKSSKDNTLNITYKDILGAGYTNIGASLASISKDYNKLTLNVKNNGTAAVKLRIDVQGVTPMGKNPDGGDMKACNLYAAQDGNEVYTDKDWGGSQFEIAAGKTSTLELYYDASKQLESIVIFIDSSDYLEDGKGIKHSGNITFSNVAFSKGTVPSKPVEPETPVVPDVPSEEADHVKADLTFNSDTYTVVKDAENGTWAITYVNVPGAGYKVISAAIEAIDAGLNRYSVTVLNNSDTTAKVRIDILDAAGSQINVSATQDGEEVNTPDGSYFEVPSGVPTTLEVVFNAAKGAKTVNFFFDSHTWGDTNTYNGDLTLSDMEFSGVLVGDDNSPVVSPDAGGNEGGEEGGETPAPTPTHPTSGDVTTKINDTEVTFAGNLSDAYGVNENEDGELEVTYNSVVGDSYKNIWANISALAAENDTFKAEITNPGDAAVKVRIDITKDSADGAMCNVSATANGNDAHTDHEYGGGSQFTIPAKASVVIEIKYDNTANPYAVKFFIDSYTYQDGNTYAGEISIANMQLKSSESEGEGEQGGTQPETPVVPDYTGKLKANWVNAGFTGIAGGSVVDKIDFDYTKAADGEEWGVCASFAPMENIAGKNTFTVKVKNNSSKDMKFRVALMNVVGEGESKVETNLFAGVSSAGSWWTDSTQALVQIGGNSEVVLKIKFNASEKALTDIIFTSTLSGVAGDQVDFTFSNFTFTTEGDAEYVQFWGNDGYTITNKDGAEYANEVNIKYAFSGEAKDSYVPCGCWLQDKMTGKDTVTFKVKNNKKADVKIRVDVEGTSGTAEGSVITLGSEAEIFVTIPYADGGKQIMLFVGPGETETDADLTITEIKCYATK